MVCQKVWWERFVALLQDGYIRQPQRPLLYDLLWLTPCNMIYWLRQSTGDVSFLKSILFVFCNHGYNKSLKYDFCHSISRICYYCGSQFQEVMSKSQLIFIFVVNRSGTWINVFQKKKIVFVFRQLLATTWPNWSSNSSTVLLEVHKWYKYYSVLIVFIIHVWNHPLLIPGKTTWSGFANWIFRLSIFIWYTAVWMNLCVLQLSIVCTCTYWRSLVSISFQGVSKYM